MKKHTIKDSKGISYSFSTAQLRKLTDALTFVKISGWLPTRMHHGQVTTYISIHTNLANDADRVWNLDLDAEALVGTAKTNLMLAAWEAAQAAGYTQRAAWQTKRRNRTLKQGILLERWNDADPEAVSRKDEAVIRPDGFYQVILEGRWAWHKVSVTEVK